MNQMFLFPETNSNYIDHIHRHPFNSYISIPLPKPPTPLPNYCNKKKKSGISARIYDRVDQLDQNSTNFTAYSWNHILISQNIR